MKRSIILAAIVLLAVGLTGIFAQQPETQKFVYIGGPQGQAGGVPGGVVTFDKRVVIDTPGTLGITLMSEGKPVKGAPYSADAVNETVQTLSDGNRITSSSTTKVYRDSEGRTRRESSSTTVIKTPGAPTATKLRQEIVTTDPVAGVSYVLDPEARTARKLPAPGLTVVAERAAVAGAQEVMEGAKTLMGEVEHTQLEVRIASGGTAIAQVERREVKHTEANANTESLGTQTIEGLEVQGTRSTVTIPAGEIGNELPIVITNETWYSPKLQIVVLSKRHDPRMGDTTYKLVNVSQAEPPASLFQLPADYTVVDMKTTINKIEVRKKRDEQQ